MMKIKKIIKTLFLISIILTITMYWFDQYVYYFTGLYDYSGEEIICSEDSNVAVIKIHGNIVTYGTMIIDFENENIYEDITSSETVVGYINKIKNDDYIEAIIVEIDSYGGSPVASEEIANALKSAGKTTVAVIREGGVSGAYLIATGADKIYASKMSDVGSIGITMSYLDYSQQNRKDGITYQQLSAGKFKDTGDPDKTLTAEEKALLMRDIKKLHTIFIEAVAKNRNLDIETIEKLADGSSMLGQDAKANGLIDEIGNIEDAENWLKTELQIEPILCIYE